MQDIAIVTMEGE